MKTSFVICILLALMLFSSPHTIARELVQNGISKTENLDNSRRRPKSAYSASSNLNQAAKEGSGYEPNSGSHKPHEP